MTDLDDALRLAQSLLKQRDELGPPFNTTTNAEVTICKAFLHLSARNALLEAVAEAARGTCKFWDNNIERQAFRETDNFLAYTRIALAKLDEAKT